MIFQHTLPQILNDQKTQTRRLIADNDIAIRTRHNKISSVLSNGRVKWAVGRTYAVQPGRGQKQVARIEIIRLNSEQLTRISTLAAIAEGFSSRKEFLRTWEHIHGPDSLQKRVWVVTFRVVSMSLYQDIFMPLPSQQPALHYAHQ